jgi:curli production assembly/transport component CsgG
MAIALLGGCSTMGLGEQGSLSAGVYKPVMTPQTEIDADLLALPPPVARTRVAVYDFPDLTGQYKDEDNYQSLSRAVTQGGGAMLIKALEDAGNRRWFTVLDRAALNDLLKERQIVTEMRKEYRGETAMNAAVLPPLADAGVVLEGGIVGYDTNTMTGGAGANFLGIGANDKWVQDTVTVTLRAVSTKTSEVLATVTVSKVIASVALDGNAFLYVSLDQLLQGETGVTWNEPKQIAVQEAIDKAVMALILKGTQLHIWSFKDKAAGDALIAKYNGETYGGTVTAQDAVPAPLATRNAAYLAQTQPLPVAARTASVSVPAATAHVVVPPAGGQPWTGGSAATAPSLPPPESSADKPM